MKKTNKEKLKIEIIEGLKEVENLDILIFIRTMVNETIRLSKKEAV